MLQGHVHACGNIFSPYIHIFIYFLFFSVWEPIRLPIEILTFLVSNLAHLGPGARGVSFLLLFYLLIMQHLQSTSHAAALVRVRAFDWSVSGIPYDIPCGNIFSPYV